MSLQYPHVTHQIGGNTSGATANIMTGTYVLAGGNNITLSQNANSVTISAGAGGGDAIRGIAAGGATRTTNTVNFQDSNGVSFGYGAAGNSTNITASHNGLTSQSTQFLALTLGGNTSGTTTFHASNNASIFLHGGNNITLSGNGSSITISAAAGGGGAPTISRWPLANVYGVVGVAPLHTGVSGATGGSTQFTASGYLFSHPFPHQLEYNVMVLLMSAQATTAGTGSATVGINVGFYTLNGNTALSLLSSYHYGMVMSQNSVSARTHSQWWGSNTTSNGTNLNGNISASYTGIRRIPLQLSAGTLSASNYYVGLMMTQRTSSVNVFGVGLLYLDTASQTTANTYMGRSDLASSQMGFNGIFSTTTNTNVIPCGLLMPASIHTSAITGSGGTSQHRSPSISVYKTV